MSQTKISGERSRQELDDIAAELVQKVLNVFSSSEMRDFLDDCADDSDDGVGHQHDIGGERMISNSANGDTDVALQSDDDSVLARPYQAETPPISGWL